MAIVANAIQRRAQKAARNRARSPRPTRPAATAASGRVLRMPSRPTCQRVRGGHRASGRYRRQHAGSRKHGSGATPTGPCLLEASTSQAENAGRSRKHNDRKQETRPALCALAHRISAYRRRAHGSVQLALSPSIPAAPFCCASKTPTANVPRPKPSTRSSKEWNGWASNWDGQTVYQFARAGRHREVAEQLLAAGQGLSLLCDAARTGRDARQAARRGKAHPLRRALARPRSIRGAGKARRSSFG